MSLLRLLFRSPRRAVAVLAVVVVLAVASAGALLVAPAEDGPEATVTAVDLRLALNDAEGIPDLGDGAHTCVSSGTPRDSVSVLGDVTVRLSGDADAPRTLVLSVANASATRETRLRGTGTVRADVFWVFEDDESLAVGENATLRLRVEAGGRPLANATRTLRVRDGAQTFDCDTE